mmetsp:Transcript_82086/g.237994  ORF Transcript_82086/g.237994 Transcript_82086/m.237994 type:complete len:248 (+) Transcript_82086:157-900(+)
MLGGSGSPPGSLDRRRWDRIGGRTNSVVSAAAARQAKSYTSAYLVCSARRRGDPLPQPPNKNLETERCTSAVVSMTSRAPTTNAVIVSDSSGSLLPRVAARFMAKARSPLFADVMPAPPMVSKGSETTRRHAGASGDTDRCRHGSDVGLTAREPGGLGQWTLPTWLPAPEFQEKCRAETRDPAPGLGELAVRSVAAPPLAPPPGGHVAHELLAASAAVNRFAGLRSTKDRHIATACSVKRWWSARSG